MFDNENEKLENIMKLKAELEKDLKKKGLLKDKPKDAKETKYDEETIKRLKENLTVSAHITEEESLTLYDINSHDYDASIDSIEKTLRIFQQRTNNINRKNIFEGLINLLNGNIKNSIASFSQAGGIEAEYNKLLAEMYSGEDISKNAVLLLKKNPDSLYPLLLLLEREMLKGSADGMDKILQILSKKSEFWNLIHKLFVNQATEQDIIQAVRERIFATLILLLNVYLDSTKEIPNLSNTCINTHRAYLRGETVTPPEWCIYGQLIAAARKYLAGYKIEIQNLRKFEKSPEFKLFLGFYHFNEGNITVAKEYFKMFESQVGFYAIYTKPLKQPKIGIEQFISIPNGFTPLKQENPSIIDFLQKNTGYDVYVNYRKYEFVRLVFSEKHCKINYK